MAEIGACTYICSLFDCNTLFATKCMKPFGTFDKAQAKGKALLHGLGFNSVR